MPTAHRVGHPQVPGLRRPIVEEEQIPRVARDDKRIGVRVVDLEGGIKPPLHQEKRRSEVRPLLHVYAH